MGKVKVAQLRELKKSEVLTKLNELRQELSQLRVAQVTNGAASKLARIQEVRKNIARVLTVINQQAMATRRDQVKNVKKGTEKFRVLKHVPKQLRAKKTRAIRRALTPHQKSLKTERQRKKELNFPLRRFALKA